MPAPVNFDSMEKEIKVSVLLAARNEEHQIIRCLTALSQLTFPRNEIEILIGNDASTDRTEELIRKFIVDKPQFTCFNIGPSDTNLKGKTNVLAQLAHKAKGTYYFYTDADIAVPQGWIQAMLSHFTETDGVVVGVTRIETGNFLSCMQSTEWVFALGLIRAGSRFGIPVTGMGNNMAITAEAYWSVGGYEQVGFSIVEDYAIFMAIIQRGYSFKQAYQTAVITVSTPMPDYIQQLNQRKRWMAGVMQSPWVIRLALVLSATHVPLLLLLGCWMPMLSLWLALSSYVLISAGAFAAIKTLKIQGLYQTLPLFWFYFNINNLVMLVNYILPTPTVWKGRHYP